MFLGNIVEKRKLSLRSLSCTGKPIPFKGER
jgi:hypothetical protein